VTGVTEWLARFNAQRVNDQMIEALWVEGKPIYSLENVSIITGVLDPDLNLRGLIESVGLGAISGVTPTFHAFSTDPAVAEMDKSRYFSVPLTEAGGAIAAADIVPAVAGYTSHCCVNGIWAPAGTTDAANDWTFTVAAGTILGPDVFDMDITAERYHNFSAGVAGVYGPAITLRGTVAAGVDNNKAIQVEAANLANVGIDYYIDGIYWYE